MSHEKPVHVPKDHYPAAMYPQVLVPSSEVFEGSETHLIDYWHVLLLRKWTILAVLFTVVTVTLIYTFKEIPVYRATATVQIDRENQNILTFKDVYEIESSTDDTLRTQFEILKSRSLARRVIEDLKLDQTEEFMPGPPTLLGSFRESVSKIFVPKVETTAPKESDTLRRIINGYLNRLEVSPVARARLVNVSFKSKDPELAARVIDAHAKHFIEQNLLFKWNATQDASAFLQQNLVTLQSDLEKSEDRLQAYSRENQILFTEEGKNTATAKLQQLETEYTRAQAERFDKESFDRVVRDGNTEALPQLMNNQLVNNLQSKLVDLRRQESELSATFEPGYPLLKRLRSQITDVQGSLEKSKTEIVNTVKAEFDVAKRREELLAKEVEKQKALVEKINQEIIQYNIMKREVDSNRQLYEGLLTRLKEAGVSAGLKASNIRIVDRAEVPTSPVSPNKSTNFLLSLAVGLILGLGLAFSQEYLDNSIKAPEDVNRYLSLPTLGMIPKLESLSGKRGYAYGKAYGYTEKESENLVVKNAQLDRIVYEAPSSLMAEAYRSVRTSLLLSSADHPPRTIVVTSAAPSEGKTVTTINLALSLTQTGARVVLIDADMRKPRIHPVFSLQNTVGLSAFLAGTAPLRETIQETAIPGLFVIPCGVTPPNRGELILSTRFRQMLQALLQYFDYIVLDSPPVGNVSDSRIIASAVDSSILVVKAFSTSRHQAREAVKHLLEAKSRVAGVVLNDVDVRLRSRYSGYSYYREYYSAYGSYGASSSQKV